MTEKPRVLPLEIDEVTSELKPIIEKWPYRLHRTLAHSPKIMQAWMVFAEPVLLDSSLLPRDREIAILRIAWNARSAYEWGMHSMVARRIGMTDEDIAATTKPPHETDFSLHEQALLGAVDDIMNGWKIGDENWAVLADTFSDQNFVDLSLLIGEFLLVALTLNSLGVEPEDGLAPLPSE